MAKRKRLILPDTQQATPERAPENKGVFTDVPTGLVPSAVRTRITGKSAPIADMAGAAAASAALEEVSSELSNARSEGRFAAKLTLDSIDAGHLMRDRITVDSADMDTLISSISNRGQQTPIEVLEVSPGHYGLISGWRRLSAMRRLFEKNHETRFGHIHAIIRSPDSAQDAYLAMVEENEIRVGLSYFERAQIVVRTVQAGVYLDTKSSLQTLFSNASRAKRSKIKSFIPIVEELGSVLKYPTAIGERMGLELSKKLADGVFTESLHLNIQSMELQTLEAEQGLISAALSSVKPAASPRQPKTLTASNIEDAQSEALAPNLHMTVTGSTLKLTGSAVTPALADRLRSLLRAQ